MNIIYSMIVGTLVLFGFSAHASVKKAPARKHSIVKRQQAEVEVQLDPQAERSVILQHAVKYYGGEMSGVDSGSPVSHVQFIAKDGNNVRCMFQGLTLACVEVSSSDEMFLWTLHGFNRHGKYTD